MSFREPLAEQCSRLWRVTDQEWVRVLHWLDTSGLALYFFDRMNEIGWTGILPAQITARFRQNLEDNTGRMLGLMQDAARIHEDFAGAGLQYALLKGFSLWPHSVPRMELRSQLDLDFLVAERDIAAARGLLERQGYHLHAISGRSYEFKTKHLPSATLKDLYRKVPFRSVELHVEARSSDSPSLLSRVEIRELGDSAFPVLRATDLFVGQGLHLFKHVCSEFFRSAHLIEFARHVHARRKDGGFWEQVQECAEGSVRHRAALGAVAYLIEHTTGQTIPDAFREWTVRELPRGVKLWVDTYGRQAALASPPGSKTYLLLQGEIEAAGVPSKRPVRQALLPKKLPPLLTVASENTSLADRVAGYRIQLRYVLLRLRFHLIAGCEYVWERRRWLRLLRSARG